MRRKLENAAYIMFYPGFPPDGTMPRGFVTQISIETNGGSAYICGDDPITEDAVFTNPQELRNLADTLYEAAEVFEKIRAARKLSFP